VGLFGNVCEVCAPWTGILLSASGGAGSSPKDDLRSVHGVRASGSSMSFRSRSSAAAIFQKGERMKRRIRKAAAGRARKATGAGAPVGVGLAFPDDDMPIWGAEAIGVVLNRRPRQAYHLLEAGMVPGAKKIGGTWMSTKRKLRALLD
jgi:hypothetical protein